MNNDTNKPGIREQHLLRMQSSSLFGEKSQQIDAKELERARLHDNSDREQFMEEFGQLVQQATDLEPNTPSETILTLKENLDQCYQRACTLPGDQTEVKHSIKKLIGIIMQSIWDGIGNDAYAKRKLEDERQARQEHFSLQEIPLAAALTHMDSPIANDEFIPCLLSEANETLAEVLHLFDGQQMAIIVDEAKLFLTENDPQRSHTKAWEKLTFIEAHYRATQPPGSS